MNAEVTLSHLIVDARVKRQLGSRMRLTNKNRRGGNIERNNKSKKGGPPADNLKKIFGGTS